MPDAFHYFSSDLALSATGDLLIADGDEESKQRVLRRLLTCEKDYLWQPDYGAGLPARIGDTPDENELAALIRAQMYLEASVSHDPQPSITLQRIANGVAAQIQYVTADGSPQYLGFDINP